MITNTLQCIVDNFNKKTNSSIETTINCSHLFKKENDSVFCYKCGKIVENLSSFQNDLHYKNYSKRQKYTFNIFKYIPDLIFKPETEKLFLHIYFTAINNKIFRNKIKKNVLFVSLYLSILTIYLILHW
jgi:hypothetical protein